MIVVYRKNKKRQEFMKIVNGKKAISVINFDYFSSLTVTKNNISIEGYLNDKNTEASDEIEFMKAYNIAAPKILDTLLKKQ